MWEGYLMVFLFRVFQGVGVCASRTGREVEVHLLGSDGGRGDAPRVATRPGACSRTSSAPASPPRASAWRAALPRGRRPAGSARWTLSALRRRLARGRARGRPARSPSPGDVRRRRRLRGSWIEAIALPGLGHELLDGLVFRSSPGFELWLESERRHVGDDRRVLHQAALARSAGEPGRGPHAPTSCGSTLTTRTRTSCSSAACARPARWTPLASRVHGALPARAGHRADAALRARRVTRLAPRLGRARFAQLEAGEAALGARGAEDAGLQRMRGAVAAAARSAIASCSRRRWSALGGALVHSARGRTRKARPRCTKDDARRAVGATTSRRRAGVRSAGCSSCARTTSARRSRSRGRTSWRQSVTRSWRGPS